MVLLADQSAHYFVAGLSQLERSLRTLEECFAGAIAEGNAPEVVIVWKSPELLERRISRLAVTVQVAGQDLGASPPGATLLLRSNTVFRRGALARLLRSPEGVISFAVLESGALPGTWAALEHALPPARDDESVWVLNDPTDVPRVARLLLRATGKSTDGLVSRNLNRPLSRLLSRWLLQTRITPNQISFLVLGILTGATWMLARGTPRGFVIGMLLFQLASVLDGCDGEIARAKFLETRLGAFLDTSVDLLGNFLLALAVAVGLSRQPGLAHELSSNYLLEGVLTAAGILLTVFAVARVRPAGRRDQFNDFGSSTVARFRMPRPLAVVLRWFTDLTRRDSYSLLFVLFAVLGRPEWILHGLAIGVVLHFPVIALSWWKGTRVPAPINAPDRS